MSATSFSARKLIRMAEKAYEKGEASQVISHCQIVLKHQPRNSQALLLIGKVQFAIGNVEEAARFFEQAIACDPQNVDAYLIYAHLLTARDRANDALQITQRAIQVAPNNPDTYCTLAFVLLHFNQAHIAHAYLSKVIPQIKEHLELLQYYAISLKVDEHREEADRVYEDIRKRYRVPSAFQIMYETYLPRLMLSTEEINRCRQQFEASLDRFIKEHPVVDVSALSMMSIFKLAFHNRDNKTLMRKYSHMLRACLPEINFVAPHCQHPEPVEGRNMRIGFVSRHMHDHPVGRCFRNWLYVLHEEGGFDVTLYQVEHITDDSIQTLAGRGIAVVSLPKNISSAQERIAQDKPDILIYPDIGMDVTTHYLAHARLAPYQAALLGHPDTTGIDTIDYYISSRYYEVEGAQENYTETLLLHDELTTIFARPPEVEHWYSRKELELPEDKHLYACPMAIQKLHPDMDNIFKQVLEQDGKAVLLLFADYKLQSSTERLKQRILGVCPADRVIFLPWQPMEKLWSILKTSEAVFSTIYFGAGTTAQYAFGYGIPIVTMPGHYARSRIVAAYYEKMGIDDAPVAQTQDDYVRIALRLANEPKYREYISRQILQKNAALFEENRHGAHIPRLIKAIITQSLAPYSPTPGIT